MKKTFFFGFILGILILSGMVSAQSLVPQRDNNSQQVQGPFIPPGCRPGISCTAVPLYGAVYLIDAPILANTPTITPTGTLTPSATPTATPSVTNTNTYVSGLLTASPTNTATPTFTPTFVYEYSGVAAATTGTPTPIQVIVAPGTGVYTPWRFVAFNPTTTDATIDVYFGTDVYHFGLPAGGQGYDGDFPDLVGNCAVSVAVPPQNTTVYYKLWRKRELAPRMFLKAH